MMTLRFTKDKPELVELFRSFRDSLQYPFPEEGYPDGATFFMVMQDGAPVARAALTPNAHMPADTLLFGFFEAEDNLPAARMLFDAMAEHGGAVGRRRLVGPVNGSTWNAYRIALPEGTPFFLDVISQPYYQSLFENSGFDTLADYFSSKSDLDENAFPNLGKHHNYFISKGLHVNKFDPSQAEAQLREIHALSCRAFKGNVLYTPVAEGPFMAKYLPLIAKADPQFIFMLRDQAGRLVGYHFAIRNMLCRDRLELVQKTIALSPELRGQGLGGYLMENCRRTAWQNGYSAVYHALMYAGNISTRFNAARQRIVRRYKLYFRELA